jgi:Fe-S cluster assembly scaffold protein SufB
MITNNKIKYGLKIHTDFTAEEIINHTHIINIDKREHRVIREESIATLSFGKGLGDRTNNFLSHTIINLNVEGASVEFIGRYKANKSLCDVSCVVNHNADNTKSSINIRGIAELEGKIISRSNIFVQENVRGVEGEEKCKYIFVVDGDERAGLVRHSFSEGGEIDAIPNLDINSHEVKVSHAVSISKIKKADIWYAGLHGASEKEAVKSFEENFLN